MWKRNAARWITISVTVAGCSSSQGTSPKAEESWADAEPAEISQPEEKPPVDIGEGIPFHDKSHPQQEAFMRQKVVPRMQELFWKSPDAEEFAEFGCVTCHGEGAKKDEFHMPAPHLPELDPADNFASSRAEHPKMTEFMMQTVVPAMAELLQEPPFDPSTGKGFGCHECHRIKGMPSTEDHDEGH